MAGIGMYGVYYSKATIANGVVTGYAGVQTMGKAISASFEPSTPDDNPLYANNAVAENDSSGASGGTLTLTLDRLTQDAAADLYGLTVEDVEVTVGDTPGTQVEGTALKYTGTEQSAPVGVAFIRQNQVDGVRNHEVILYRRVTFSMPADNAQTMGESIEWQTPEISGTVMGLEGDGSNAWFEQVIFPTQEAAIAYITDYFKAGILPLIVGTIYCVFMYRLIPNGSISSSDVKEVKDAEPISKKNELFIFGVFIAIMAGFMFTNQLGSDITNVIPAAGLLVLIVFKVLSIPEVMKSLTSDMVWMVAGMSVVSTALSATGAGELIGETVLKILGGNPSGLFVSIVFCVACTLMTNFMSNMGTMALMSPIAASTALAGGMNVRAVVLTCCVSAWFAIVLPTGCSGAMMAFGIGNHNAFKLMKFTLPLLLLLMISLIIGINIFFPIYG